MNRTTKGIFEKVRDTQGDPIFLHDYIEGLVGKQLILNGYPVVIDDTMANGDIDQMLLDPYTKKGSLIVYTEKEFFEMIQRSDAIIVAAATVNGP